jgi:cytoskeletal protein CcmA (bactofilin family)
MAGKWFGRNEQKEAGEWIGFLEKGVKLDGTLELTGTFRLDAQMKGTILSQQTLILGDNARVEGQIEGNHVVVAGRFDGVIFAKGRVEIQPKGVVTGEIHTPCLVVEAGGVFDGRCHMLASAEAAKPLTIPVRAASKG